MIRLGAFVAAIGSLSVVAVAFIRYPGVVSGAQTWVLSFFFAALLFVYTLAAIGFGGHPLRVEGPVQVGGGAAKHLRS